ncbi:MAG: hypothetical protein QM401_00595 [Bacillota bacterium]|nr:hypothetical protein [Bacillota bacterium]
MNTYVKVTLLVVLSLVLSASTLMIPARFEAKEDNNVLEFERLLAEEEEILKAYEQELIEKGEQFLMEQESQLRRAQEQELHDATKELISEFETKASELQREIAKKRLRNQLELVLVSLNEDQQSAKMQQISESNSEFIELQKEIQLELEMHLAELRLEHEAIWVTEKEELRTRLEGTLAEQFSVFQEERWKIFEEKISNLAPELRRQLANR